MSMEKKKIDLAFVILHYMAADDTIECVASVAEHNDVTEGEIRQRQFAAVLRQSLSGRAEVYFTPYVEIFT